MSLDTAPSLPIPPKSPQNDTLPAQNDTSTAQTRETTDANTTPTPTPPLTRSNRPSRACTIRASQRLYARQQQAAIERRQKPAKKEQQQQKQYKDENDGSSSPQQQCSGSSKIVTPLVGQPEPSQLPRWSIRSMWELASVLNFLHVFRPLLNIAVEFSAEEFETALITPNDTLGDIHIPLLKAIPPIIRISLTRDTWVTVLCRKLRDWWHWVADGDLPVVASHGVELEVYKSLDPGVRVVILKALCDIRVEQEDIRNYIDNSLKHGVQISAFRKERIGGDSQGITYWYEDDPVVGHRLYREIRKVELKKAKMKGSHVPNSATYLWETVATNLEEFQDVSEKLFASKNRTEASLGKKLKNDKLPEIEKEHKRKERLLKKQHRQALLLDNFLIVDGLAPGRSLRDRKPVTYTFDDYDWSINEAIKITKRKPPSPDPLNRRDVSRPETSANGKLSGPSPASEHENYNLLSPKSPEYDDFDDNRSGELDRSNRRRQRPQRYSAKEFIEAVSDNEADFDSDDDIVGEAIYDEDYLRKRKRGRQSSSSEGDEEYRWDEEDAEDEEEEEEEEDLLSISEDSDAAPKFKKLPGRTRRETKLRSVDELQSGLRRSKRASRNRINYKQYELSESETESKPEKSNPSDDQSDASKNEEYSEGSLDSNGNDDDQEMEVDPPVEDNSDTIEKEQSQPPEQSNGLGQDEVDVVKKRRFLDLNELAPCAGFDDGPNTITKDDNRSDL
ncbi:DDT domain-containing protein DDR4-like isoform X2 [Durio zibethinus]|uniref:DDT domain-containing protein DDR4-like isoform X2 n=1 Tax=Durio zibethinus TaxID=66656 RepID=A0A6P6ATB0_DURZI|nr:DDT domain-containing protein DDR4-like isoform X2 [Durio zibethinus]